jgi:hypothetical protein
MTDKGAVVDLRDWLNTMTIDGVTAVIAYDPDINQFRRKFLGFHGGADFYADDISGLKREGALSLKVFREACAEDDLEDLYLAEREVEAIRAGVSTTTPLTEVMKRYDL